MPYYPGSAAGAADGVNIVSAGTQNAGTNATVVFSNSNNVSFGMNASSVVTASASVAAGAGDGVNIIAAGTQTANTTGTISFADSNGITFGLSNSSIMTATVKTDYQTSGNYLTTAMASNAATISNIKVSGGANSANLSAITFSDSNGISFGLSANSVMTATVKTDYQSSNANYLTSQSNQAASAANGSFAFQTVSFSNLNGISFGTSAGSAITASHNAITTGRASNDAIGLNTAKTNVTWTVNSSGISLDAGAYLTTAQPVGAYLTTARASNDAIGLNTAKTNVTWTVNSSGLSLDAGAYLTTAQPVGAYLTTARASNDAIGLNTAFSNVTATVNSSGLSLDARGYAGTATAATNATFTLNSAGLSLSVGAGGAGDGVNILAAGTQTANTTGSVSFADSNGITFGMSNSSVITATVATNYQSQGAYLTTAAQSNQVVNSINGSTGTFSLNTGSSLSSSRNGNAITFGLASNITTALQSAGAYLTTAAQSSASNLSGVIAATASNAATNQTAQLSGAISFSNTNGVSFYTTASGAVSGIGATVATNYQSQGAYLTTARASNDAVGLNTAQTNVTWTVNSSGISLNAGAYLTTAMASNRGTDFVQANAVFNGTNASGTIASNAISVSVAAPAAGVGIVAGTRTATTAGSLLFDNANGITFGLNGNGSSIMTASHNALTTARASTDALGLNTAQSNVTWTANSSGLSLDARGYAGTATGATNASVTVNSGGVSVSVAAPGAAAENNWVNLLGANTAGNTTASGSTIGLSGVNLTLSGTNGSAINISAPATSSLSATGQVSLSTNGSTISVGVPNAVTLKHYNEFKESPMVAGNIGQGTLHLQPWNIPNLQFDRVVVHKIFSNATNSSGSFTVSDWVGIYTENVSTLSLLYSTSATTNFSGSGTAGSYLSYGGGLKAVTMGLTQTLTEGRYYIGVINRTTTGGVAGHTLNQALHSQVNTSYNGLMGVATNASNQMTLGFGAYSVTTAGMPNSIAYSEVRGNSSAFLRPPSLFFASGTI